MQGRGGARVGKGKEGREGAKGKKEKREGGEKKGGKAKDDRLC